MAISIGEIKYTPDPIKAGAKVKATCVVTADVEIESVKLYDPDYQVLQAYDDGTHGDEVAGDDIYTLETDAPYDAPPGTYYVTLVVTDKEGNTERKNVPVEIA